VRPRTGEKQENRRQEISCRSSLCLYASREREIMIIYIYAGQRLGSSRGPRRVPAGRRRAGRRSPVSPARPDENRSQIGGTDHE
jgi:hypothetical protein